MRCANASVSTIEKLSKYEGCTSASAPAIAESRTALSTKPVTTMSCRSGTGTTVSPTNTSVSSLGLRSLYAIQKSSSSAAPFAGSTRPT